MAEDAAGTAPPDTDAGGRTEKDKMLAGELYFAFGPQLTAERLAARRLLGAFNAEVDPERRVALLQGLLGSFDEADPPFIEPPLRCDYGAWLGLVGWLVVLGWLAAAGRFRGFVMVWSLGTLRTCAVLRVYVKA